MRVRKPPSFDADDMKFCFDLKHIKNTQAAHRGTN